jgi:3',5'-cyclic AMP phosphodiesterase CpdA
MKLAVIGDIHLISDLDPYKGLHTVRDFFKSAWPSFRDLVQRINAESPDLVIFLGDLVDWLSPENADFALDLIGGLDTPWVVTPGNHDLAPPDGDHGLERFRTSDSRDHVEFWSARGVDMSNRAVSAGDWTLLLMDSALSNLADGSEQWLANATGSAGSLLLFTHVPIDTPETQAHITSAAPGRNMTKYVLSGASQLYERYLEGRVRHAFGGHVHLPLHCRAGAMTQHICGMAITMHDPGRNENSVASATIVTLDGPTVKTEILAVQ